MTDEVLAEQVSYYRRRAAEYDATAYGDVATAANRIERLVEQMQPCGAVLEIACGTGMWSAALARRASTLTAVDAAPETIEVARSRVVLPNVTFEVADIFTWTTSRRFDVIFFSAWLSHVPTSRFDQFWALLRPMLADGGRVLFIDEHTDEVHKESYTESGGEMIERTLLDGSRFHIVKNFVDPDHLTTRLERLGWHSRIDRDGSDWVRGEARPQ
ncbi:MAG: class I SAM-dependent methyltransferase [Actinomycetota bacterium]|nr:class I SAM-dependent methyltransferase [Actinomycetota bacterium]